MAGVALTLWLLTIGGGVMLLFIWLARGGAQHPADVSPDSPGGSSATTTTVPRSRIAISTIVLHASLAVVGAMVWLIYNADAGDDNARPAAFLALVMLVLAIGYGVAMFSRWLADRREGDRADPADLPPEQHFPALLVLLHGAMALATLVAVVIAID